MRFTVPTGVTALPILAPIDSVPLLAALVAARVTTELAFVLPASIVDVIAKVEALGAVRLKVPSAAEAPLTVMVPVAVSCR